VSSASICQSHCIIHSSLQIPLSRNIELDPSFKSELTTLSFPKNAIPALCTPCICQLHSFKTTQSSGADGKSAVEKHLIGRKDKASAESLLLTGLQMPAPQTAEFHTQTSGLWTSLRVTFHAWVWYPTISRTQCLLLSFRTLMAWIIPWNFMPRVGVRATG